MNSSVVANERVASARDARGRVLHVITRLDQGGSADNTVVSCLRLAERGWDVQLVYGLTRDPTPRLAELQRHGSVACSELPALLRPVRPLADLRAYLGLRRILRRGDYDLLHTHSSKAGLLGRCAARGLRCKVVHTPHGHVFHDYFGRALTRLFISMERRAARWCDRIVTLTDRGHAEHLDQGIGRPEMFVTIPSGVPTDHFRHGLPEREASREALGLPDDAYVIGSVGHLAPIKGHIHLLEAVERLVPRLPAARVLLVGEGSQRALLEARAAAGPLRGRVVFTGLVADPRPALAAMDLFVMPSLNEGQGRAAVEAMAAGLPVVATAVGGLPEVLDQGAAGRIVPPRDPQALAHAILELATSPVKASSLALAARSRAEHFSEKTMIDRLDALYRELLPQPGAAVLP